MYLESFNELILNIAELFVVSVAQRMKDELDLE